MTFPAAGPPADQEPAEANGSGSVSEVHPDTGGLWADAPAGGSAGDSVMTGDGRTNEPGGGRTKDRHPNAQSQPEVSHG